MDEELQPDAALVLRPIGYFRCAAKYPYDAARQAVESQGGGGRVELLPGCNYEQAAAELAGFSRVWLVYWFHHNRDWKPRVLPPRGAAKVGVFATRAPYRPNPIGLSCVALTGVHGRTLEVGAHDLLDGTPILDIKPYLPYADSFPDAACGWVDAVALERWEVEFTPEAEAQLAGLPGELAAAIRVFVAQQLSEQPVDVQRKRVRALGGARWELAYRTWRVGYVLDEAAGRVRVGWIGSGYSAEDLAREEDSYGDKAVHRAFVLGGG